MKTVYCENGLPRVNAPPDDQRFTLFRRFLYTDEEAH